MLLRSSDPILRSAARETTPAATDKLISFPKTMPAKTTATNSPAITVEPARIGAAEMLGAEYFTGIPQPPRIATVTAGRTTGPRQAPWECRTLSPCQRAGLERAGWTGDVAGYQSQTFMPSDSARDCFIPLAFSLTTKQRRGKFYSAMAAAMLNRGPLSVADAVALAAATPVSFSSAAVLGAKLANACGRPIELVDDHYRVVGESVNRQLQTDLIEAAERDPKMTEEEKEEAIRKIYKAGKDAEDYLLHGAATMFSKLAA